MISKPIMDMSVPEKDKVTFDCEVSRTNTEVKWFKVRNHYAKNSTLSCYKNIFFCRTMWN